MERFLVAYNAMRIERIEDMKRQYTKDDYKRLDEFYKSKIQQIHIVGEYAKKMANDEERAQLFVKDYFSLNHDSFLRKYFKGRESEISKNITPKKYKKTIWGTIFETVEYNQGCKLKIYSRSRRSR